MKIKNFLNAYRIKIDTILQKLQKVSILKTSKNHTKKGRMIYVILTQQEQHLVYTLATIGAMTPMKSDAIPNASII
jgi:hypothetical protein